MTKRILVLSADKSLVEIFNALDGFEVHVSEETWYITPKGIHFDVVIADVDSIRLTGNIKGNIQISSVAFAVVSPENLPTLDRHRNIFHDIWVKPIYPSLVPNRIAQGLEYQVMKLSKAHFMEYLRHEIKGYVTPIVGYSDILKRGGLGEVSVQQKQCLELIYTNARRLTDFIDQFIDFSKFDTTLAIAPNVIIVSDIIQHLQTPSLSEAFAKKEVDLVIDIPNELSPVFADMVRILQVLTFLLINALEYSPQGGRVILSAKVEYDAKIRFLVTDTGEGFEAGSFTALMESLEAKGDDLAKARRIQLRITHYWLYESGSQPEMNSELGKGATFHFTVPIAKTPDS